jgi:polyvinyl alcohol dehydrogenase (cytochrome)
MNLLADAVSRRRRAFRRWSSITLAALVISVFGGATQVQRAEAASGTPTWPSYLFNNAHSGDQTAPQPRLGGTSKLTPGWSAHANGPVSAQPVLANNLVYWGSWDGYERATTLSGRAVWSAFLGQTVTPSNCFGATLGVGSTATVATVGGRSILYVGGGDTNLYALDAMTGAVIWKTSLNAGNGTYLWSSPTVSNGYVYEGVSSAGDCPLSPGEMVQLSAQGLVVQHVFPLVPPGCNGAGVWGSPTVDEAAGTVYFGTANSDCFPTPYANVLMELHASDLSLVSYWAVPAGPTEDFGSTPTLFTATIGGVTHQMVGISDKNGLYYAFDRNQPLSNGPVWSARIDVGGDNPEAGQGPISPSAWDGASLYVAGGNTTIGGTSCAGSVRALDPATGNFLWQHCLSDPVLGAVSVAQGVAVVGSGRNIVVVSTSSGATRFTFQDTSSSFFFQFWGPASIAGSTIYYGNMDGTLFTFAA